MFGFGSMGNCFMVNGSWFPVFLWRYLTSDDHVQDRKCCGELHPLAAAATWPSWSRRCGRCSLSTSSSWSWRSLRWLWDQQEGHASNNAWSRRDKQTVEVGRLKFEGSKFFSGWSSCSTIWYLPSYTIGHWIPPGIFTKYIYIYMNQKDNAFFF